MAFLNPVLTEEKHKCPPHHFSINSENVGHCKDCSEVRDFGRLLQREGVFAEAGRRGARARKETLGKKSRQSAAMKKLWQDPEY